MCEKKPPPERAGGGVTGRLDAVLVVLPASPGLDDAADDADDDVAAAVVDVLPAGLPALVDEDPLCVVAVAEVDGLEPDAPDAADVLVPDESAGFADGSSFFASFGVTSVALASIVA